jgi:hypothetical protein
MAKETTQYVYIPKLDKEGKRARLTLLTDKQSSGGIYSAAQIEFESPDGGTTFLLCGDFRKNVLRTPSLRGTQKSIDTHHATAFTPEAIEALKMEALAFYADAAKRFA